MSILKRQVNSSSSFASFFIVMTHNSCVDFRLILFLLWIKGSHQSPNFETFKCSGENLPYSLCHFPNYKSVFLEILHHHSVSWKITPLYFRQALESPKSWNSMGYICLRTAFLQLKHIQKIYLTLLSTTCVKIYQISYVIFETKSHFSRHNSSVLFSLKCHILLTKISHQSANFQIFGCSS